MLEYALFLLFPFLMIYASFTDLFEMTISNKVSLALILGFMTFAIMAGMTWEAILWHWAMFVVVLFAGFALFAAGIIGGGDAKLAASTSLWLGWTYVMPYLLVAGMLGGLLTILLLKFRSELLPQKFQNVEWIVRLHDNKTGVPYGIALGISALLYYPQTDWTKYATVLAQTL